MPRKICFVFLSGTVLENKNKLCQMRSIICYPVSAWKTFYKCRKSIEQTNIDNISASIMSQPHEIEFAAAYGV